MHMAYGEFCAFFELEPSPDVLRFWLLSHLLTPHLAQQVIEKRRSEIHPVT